MYGADRVTQDFLDETIEDNVSRCGHARPAHRADPRQAAAKAKAKPKKWWRGRDKKPAAKVSAAPAPDNVIRVHEKLPPTKSDPPASVYPWPPPPPDAVKRDAP